MSKIGKKAKDIVQSIVRTTEETTEELKQGIIQAGTVGLGENLLAKASEEFETESQRMVLEQTKHIIRLRNEREEWARNALRARDFYNEKLKAIQDGKFDVIKDGYGYKVRFHENRLNAADLAI